MKAPCVYTSTQYVCAFLSDASRSLGLICNRKGKLNILVLMKATYAESHFATSMEMCCHDNATCGSSVRVLLCAVAGGYQSGGAESEPADGQR